MEGVVFPRAGHIRRPRLPDSRVREAMDAPSKLPGIKMVSRVMPRASASTSSDSPTTSCAPGDNTGVCEKPVSGSTTTLTIVLGVVIPVVVLICVLIYLHRRNLQKQKQEDATDPHKSLDFGLGDDKGGAGKRKSMLGLGGKDHSRYRQLSMDMNLSTPYLLPQGLQGSRESLHSLARTLHQNEDPYGPVAHYAASDAASTRSMRKMHDGSSTYTDSTKGQGSATRSHSVATSGTYVAPPRQNSLPKSPSQPEPAHIRATTAAPEDLDASPTSPVKDPFRLNTELTLPDFGLMPYPDETSASTTMPVAPVVQDPPAAAQRIARRPIEPQSATVENIDGEPHASSDHTMPPQAEAQPPPNGPSESRRDANGHHLDRLSSPSHYEAYDRTSQPSVKLQSADSPPLLPSLNPVSGVIVEEPEGHHAQDLPHASQNEYGQQEQYDYDDRGRTMHRESMNYQAAQTGLGIPEQDTRRLSVGLRPLPPDEFIESEDPETRANRIRSFYKEYFDDSKPDPMPVNPAVGYHQHGGVDYYEDYDHNYSGEPAYYDPASNSFVMPYAQPVARRAMTPPPSRSRFPGPRGPPRGPHGSLGGASLPGGRGPPRPGSAASSNYGPRPGSSVSNAWGRPRAGSAMSGSRFGGPRKPMPPPAALTTLPTPSKLRDDSFAINPIDFAPPETFRDRAAGRSQSPAGERRPYQLNVPVHSPLVNAFEELPSLPSPHLLRKSGTFTALDFAPPRKFQDADTRSETGSIRSNRSGISTAQLSAIRGGAGRVSRLPEDSIFTAAQVQQKLKPSWNMRD